MGRKSRQLTLDHLAVCATSLEAGVAYVEDTLGVSLVPGGQHVQMGTHNRLLSLGPEIYLEVIAIDPGLTPPDRARWFDLDNFTGPPMLTNWIARCDDLGVVRGRMADVQGDIMHLERGDLRWQMLVPQDGILPFVGAFPGLISWSGALHPAAMLPDVGCRLEGLTITHSDAVKLNAALTPHLESKIISIVSGPAPRIVAAIRTPGGLKTLA